MKEFISKLRKLQVRQIKKTLMQKTLEDGASNVGSSEFFTDANSEHVNAGIKRHGDSFEHLYRRSRMSARTNFLAGR